MQMRETYFMNVKLRIVVHTLSTLFLCPYQWMLFLTAREDIVA